MASTAASQSRNAPPTRSMSISLYGNREYISNAPLGLDEAGRGRIDLELAAQAQHLDVDAPIEHVFMNAGAVQKLLARQGPLWRTQEGNQQRIFAFGERHCLTVR